MTLRVTVFDEGVQKRRGEIDDVYPDGIDGTLAELFRDAGHEVRTATLTDPQHGLDEETIEWTDVLVWWSHIANDELDDAVADRVVEAVQDGMGFLALHSGKNSKPFRRLMGTSCGIKYRVAGERERVWVVDPGHPIADGLPEHFEIPETEMYGEPYDVPEPDRTVFVSWFEGGEVFRSGLCYRRGRGRIFAFRPGHESYPIFHQDEVRQVIRNAVEWAAPTEGSEVMYGEAEPIEPLEDS